MKILIFGFEETCPQNNIHNIARISLQSVLRLQNTVIIRLSATALIFFLACLGAALIRGRCLFEGGAD